MKTNPAPTLTGDDRKHVFESYKGRAYHLNEASLTTDCASLTVGSLDPLLWSATELAFPVGFRTGSDTPPAAQLQVTPATLDFGTLQTGAVYTNVHYHARLTNNLAHLIVATLENERSRPIIDAGIDPVFALYADSDGIVLDLRNNSGGNEANAIRFAFRFTTEPQIFGYVRYRQPKSKPSAFGLPVSNSAGRARPDGNSTFTALPR